MAVNPNSEIDMSDIRVKSKTKSAIKWSAERSMAVIVVWLRTKFMVVKVKHEFIPREYIRHIQAHGHKLTNWHAKAYIALYKRHMNINAMARQPWPWHMN